MVIKSKRGLRSSGLWPLLSVGPAAIDLLIQKLNAGRGREAEALRELVRTFNQLDDMGRDRGFPHVSNAFEKFSSRPEAHLGFDGPSVKRMKKIQAAFRSYRLVPLPAYPQKDGWKFHYLQPWGTGNTRGIVQWLYLAVIHDLAVIGRLRRVRQCDYCRRWFFAERNDQRFCLEGNCSEKHWRTSAAGRAKRAAYMRRYRQGLDRRNRNALKVAKNLKRDGHRSNRK